MLYDRGISCCFTGHRAQKLPWGTNEKDSRAIRFRLELQHAVTVAYGEGYRHFICGMATGGDTVFGEILVKARPYLPGLSIEAAVPCRTQADGWSPADRRRYDALLSSCDVVNVLQENYTSNCMLNRNRYMVDHSSLLLAAFSGVPGGTLQTINYAIRCGLEIRYIPVP